MEEVDSIPEGAAIVEINENAEEIKTDSNDGKKKAGN